MSAEICLIHIYTNSHATGKHISNSNKFSDAAIWWCVINLAVVCKGYIHIAAQSVVVKFGLEVMSVCFIGSIFPFYTFLKRCFNSCQN